MEGWGSKLSVRAYVRLNECWFPFPCGSHIHKGLSGHFDYFRCKCCCILGAQCRFAVCLYLWACFCLSCNHWNKSRIVMIILHCMRFSLMPVTIITNRPYKGNRQTNRPVVFMSAMISNDCFSLFISLGATAAERGGSSFLRTWMMLMFIDCGPGSVVAELTQMAQTQFLLLLVGARDNLCGGLLWRTPGHLLSRALSSGAGLH